MEFNYTHGFEVTTYQGLAYLVINDEAILLGFDVEPTEMMELIIPNTILIGERTVPVKQIASGAFEQNEYIRTVTITSNIEIIGQSAFHAAYRIESIVFEAESQLKRIEQQAFFNINEVKQLILPEGLTHIGHNAFAYMYNLQLIEIPSTVTYVDSYAFEIQDNRNLIIVIANVGQELSWHPDWNIRNHPVYYGAGITRLSIDGMKYWIIDNQATIMGFENPNAALEELRIPASISIDGNIIPVTQIGANAFRGVQNLRNVYIPNAIIEIGSGAFRESWNIETIHFDDNSNVTYIRDYAFSNMRINHITIPKSVKSIGEMAFFL